MEAEEEEHSPAFKGGEKFHIRVLTEHYRAELEAETVYSKQDEKGRIYAASVVPLSEADKRNWLQIIHDREHSLPREIDPWMTIYDEVRRNIEMRWGKGKET